MIPYEIPEPLSVDFQHLQEAGQANTLTWLFREDNNLPQALHIARSLALNPEYLKVVSAGCSIGTEVDSLLVLHRLGDYAGSLAVTGYDASAFAIDVARKGRLSPQFSRASWGNRRREASQQAQMLRDYGFVLKGEAPGYRESYHYRYFDVDATKLRSNHDVTFTQANLLQPLSGPADLITANNMLFHMPLEEATQVVKNLAGMLSENGVLSLGEYGFGSHIDDRTEPIHARQELWPTLLSESFGLARLQILSAPEAIMFARPELHAQIGNDTEGVGVSRRATELSLEAA